MIKVNKSKGLDYVTLLHKKGDLYLHVGTVTYEEYQDYSDIDAMHMTQYRFLKQKMVLKLS